MDNLSHTLTGLALARAGLNRVCPGATAILLLSANAPDSDIVALTGGALRYLEVHRGYTHSLLGLPVLAIVPVLLVAAALRRRLPWFRAWLLSGLGIASHLLLDWTNTYGVRFLLPFSSRWFHLDWNHLYDGFFLLALFGAAVWPILANLVSGEIGERASNGRGVAVLALVAIFLFECGRVVLHDRAVAQLQARSYDEAEPIRTAALPDPYNPFRWEGVVETADAYLKLPVTTSGEPDLHSIQTFYKPARNAAWKSLKQTEPYQFVSYFARFPVWSFVPVPLADGKGTRVDLSDLRFGAPGSGAFHCTALLDANNRMLEASFSWGLP